MPPSPASIARRHLASLLVCAAAATPGLATAQPAATAAEPMPVEETFYEAIQVQTAEVEVVVTDGDGNRVIGLGREDFALYENGERVEISSFAAYAPSRFVVAAPAVEAADAQAAAPVATARSVVMVLLDNQSLTRQGRRRLLARVRESLAAGLPSGRQMGVASQDSPGALRLVLPPTDDLSAVLAALDDAEWASPWGNHMALETARIVRFIQQAPGPGESSPGGAGAAAAEDLYREIVTHADHLHRQAVASAAALEQLVAALAGLPGRKAVLLVSGGIPQRPAQALLSAWANRFNPQGVARLETELEERSRGDLTHTLARAAAHASAGRVAIYALASPSVPSAFTADMDASDAWTANEEATQVSNVQNALAALALPTGGLVGLDDGSARVALETMHTDLESYYSLAYEPRGSGRGRDRRLRVEVLRPGLRVRHRASHRLRTGVELMAEQTRAALLFGHQQNPLDLVVALAAAERGERRGEWHLPVMLRVPFAKIVLLPAGAFHEGRLTIHIAATDEVGRTSAVATAEVPVRVANAQLAAALSQPIVYTTRLVIRDARQRIAVTVRDELGNQVASVVVEHAGGSTPAGRRRRGGSGG